MYPGYGTGHTGRYTHTTAHTTAPRSPTPPRNTQHFSNPPASQDDYSHSYTRNQPSRTEARTEEDKKVRNSESKKEMMAIYGNNKGSRGTLSPSLPYAEASVTASPASAPRRRMSGGAQSTRTVRSGRTERSVRTARTARSVQSTASRKNARQKTRMEFIFSYTLNWAPGPVLGAVYPSRIEGPDGVLTSVGMNAQEFDSAMDELSRYFFGTPALMDYIELAIYFFVTLLLVCGQMDERALFFGLGIVLSRWFIVQIPRVWMTRWHWPSRGAVKYCADINLQFPDVRWKLERVVPVKGMEVEIEPLEDLEPLWTRLYCANPIPQFRLVIEPERR